jgi:hypothetical protein
LSAGLFIVLVSYLLEPVQAFLHRRCRHQQYAYLEWTANASLQLHRLAHEELDTEKWSQCTTEIPITDPEATLAHLDITALEHPVLSRALVASQEKPVQNAQQSDDDPVTRYSSESQHIHDSDQDDIGQQTPDHDPGVSDPQIQVLSEETPDPDLPEPHGVVVSTGT